MRELGLVEYPGYMVREDGVVSSCWRRDPHNSKKPCLGDTWHVIQPRLVGCYYRVTLRNRNRKRMHLAVHVLVLTAFVGPCPPGMQTRHFPDRCKTNNSLDNLIWGTKLENEHDKIVHDTKMQGSRFPNSRLLESDIPVIRARAKNGESQRTIGKDYNIPFQVIGKILRGERWTHVG